MDAVVMCGGKGTRLDGSREKPLHPIDGTPMVDRVLAALDASRVETIYAAASPNAPETKRHLEGEREDDCERDHEHEDVAGTVTPIETAGDGYVDDLASVLEEDAIEPPVLTVAADLPLLAGTIVDRVLGGHDGDGSLVVCVPVAYKERLGVSVDSRLYEADHLAPTGVNVVGDADADASDPFVSYDWRLAVNVNRIADARIADRLCR